MLGFAQLFFAHTYVEYQITDRSRIEQYQPDTIQCRTFMMHIWIPEARNNAHPLILFSHGLGDNFNGTTYQQLCCYCAARGYVVASVSHSYACKPLRFADGHLVPYLFPASFHQQLGRHMFDIEADIWLDDMMCALNECARYNEILDSPLYHKIDMSRVGAMGHSLGGSVAIQLCRNDARIKAVINLDGPLYGTHATHPIEKPFMLIIGSSAVSYIHKELIWRDYFNRMWLPQLNGFIMAQEHDVYKVTINKIVHGMFSDAALYPDEILASWIMDGGRAHEIIFAYVGAFFDTYVKGDDSSLLSMNVSPWHEVSVSKY